jgi:3-oxoacyl-[acyl-carrier protein] reductase
MQIDLSNRLAIITGASGQLGRVMAHTLAGCGADVAVHYHANETQAKNVREELKATGVRAEIFQADVTKEGDVLRLRDEVGSTLGAPDIIVNNAVIQYDWVSLLEQPLGDFQSQFDSCVLHNVLMSKAFVPAMIGKRWGRVIGINTECAIQCAPSQGAYASAKRGMDGVLRVLAREVGPHGVTVNQVAPGWTISDDDRRNGTEEQPEYSAHVPLRRRGTDQEIANAVAWLASDLAAYVTGVFLPVCGGDVMTAI